MERHRLNKQVANFLGRLTVSGVNAVDFLYVKQHRSGTPLLTRAKLLIL